MVNFKIVKNVLIDHKIFFILFLIFLSGCSNPGERPKFSGLIVGNSVDEADAINVVKKGNTLTLDIQDKLKNIAGVTTTRAIIVSEERLNIAVSEGWEIYFNTEGDLDWQIKELWIVLEKQISPEKRKNLEYVDLRFSRVFYK